VYLINQFNHTGGQIQSQASDNITELNLYLLSASCSTCIIAALGNLSLHVYFGHSIEVAPHGNQCLHSYTDWLPLKVSTHALNTLCHVYQLHKWCMCWIKLYVCLIESFPTSFPTFCLSAIPLHFAVLLSHYILPFCYPITFSTLITTCCIP